MLKLEEFSMFTFANLNCCEDLIGCLGLDLNEDLVDFDCLFKSIQSIDY